MDSSAHLSFLEDGETFVKPKVAPVLASHFISSPGVSDLMSGHVNLRLVFSDDRWGGECEQWVFHTTHWERWWQNNDAVVAPDVRSQIGLSIVKECRQ